MRKFRICRITDSFPPPWTGLAPATYELSAAQARQGCEVHVIAKFRGSAPQVDIAAPFAIHRIRAKLMLFEVLALVKLISLNRIHKFDLIHSHGSSFFFFHLLRKILPKYGIFKIPIFVSVHNIRAYQDRAYRQADFFSIAESILQRKLKELRDKKQKMLKKHRWQKIRQKISYQDADCLLPVSQGLKRALIETYSLPPEKIRVVYNGVSSAIIEKSTAQIECADTLNNKVLLFVGRTIGTKNEVSLLQAMPSILSRYPNAQLVVIGDGYWHETLRDVARALGIEANVTFINYVPHNEIITYYRNADVFVFPSFSEGLPKVVLEAMASELPVVATDVDGNNELVIDGYNGYLVRPNSPGDIAEKVLDLLKDNEQAKRLGKNGRRLVLDNFTWEKVASLCSEAYFDILCAMKS